MFCSFLVAAGEVEAVERSMLPLKRMAESHNVSAAIAVTRLGTPPCSSNYHFPTGPILWHQCIVSILLCPSLLCHCSTPAVSLKPLVSAAIQYCVVSESSTEGVPLPAFACLQLPASCHVECNADREQGLCDAARRFDAPRVFIGTRRSAPILQQHSC